MTAQEAARLESEPVFDETPWAERTFDALVVDFGGVLTTPLQDAMVRFAADVGIELQDLVRAALGGYTEGGKDSLVFDFETGRITEQEFTDRFAARLTDISGVEVPPEGLVAKIFRLELVPEMLAAVELARAGGYKTGLLSNSWGIDYYPRHILQNLFDAVIISGEVGLRKPDPAIFELTVSKLGVEPGRCVFVDDHPGHLKAALEAGMTTVLHRDPAQTIEELEGLLGLSLTLAD